MNRSLLERRFDNMNGCKYLEIDRWGEAECYKPGKVVDCDYCKYGPKSKYKPILRIRKHLKKEGV